MKRTKFLSTPGTTEIIATKPLPSTTTGTNVRIVHILTSASIAISPSIVHTADIKQIFIDMTTGLLYTLLPPAADFSRTNTIPRPIGLQHTNRIEAPTIRQETYHNLQTYQTVH